MAKVFISYSHDSNLHKRRIQDLAAHLRTHHLDVAIDQDQLPGGPDEGCSDLHPCVSCGW